MNSPSIIFAEIENLTWYNLNCYENICIYRITSITFTIYSSKYILRCMSIAKSVIERDINTNKMCLYIGIKRTKKLFVSSPINKFRSIFCIVLNLSILFTLIFVNDNTNFCQCEMFIFSFYWYTIWLIW